MKRLLSFLLSTILSIGVILSILSGSPLYADTEGGAHSAGPAVSNQIAPLPAVDLYSSIMTMAKGLAICIALLLGAVWILKKLKSPMITGQGRKLRIIERLPVSAKSSILLVEVNNKTVLIGVGSDPVNLISDFVDSDSLDILAKEPESSGKND